MSELTMLSRMLSRYRMTFDLGERDTLRLTIWDARLDTTMVYQRVRECGASALIVLAFVDYQAEYEGV